MDALLSRGNFKNNNTKKIKAMITKEDFTRINNDVNGNPRYVFHFLHLADDYSTALKKAKKIGGRKFHNKQYGGGIAIQSYNLDYEIKLINDESNNKNR